MLSIEVMIINHDDPDLCGVKGKWLYQSVVWFARHVTQHQCHGIDVGTSAQTTTLVYVGFSRVQVFVDFFQSFFTISESQGASIAIERNLQ